MHYGIVDLVYLSHFLVAVVGFVGCCWLLLVVVVVVVVGGGGVAVYSAYYLNLPPNNNNYTSSSYLQPLTTLTLLKLPTNFSQKEVRMHFFFLLCDSICACGGKRVVLAMSLPDKSTSTNNLNPKKAQ
jgi:hypothetical protein